MGFAFVYEQHQERLRQERLREQRAQAKIALEAKRAKNPVRRMWRALVKWAKGRKSCS